MLPFNLLLSCAEALMAHDVFISYSSKDKPPADATCAKLEARGIRCWIAPRDIMPGADWGSSIIDAINGARVVVLVFSAHANASQQIKREVERAVHKGIPIIPLRIENVPPESSLEYFISTPHWLDAFTPPLEQHLVYLADVIRHILDGQPVPGKPLPPPAPWRRGPGGIAAGVALLAVLIAIAWFSFLRPPPSFTGSWTATALDIRQFTTENTMMSALVPAQLLSATIKNPDAKGTLTVDASGQFTIAISGEDHGTLTAAPSTMAGPPNDMLTFASDITHQSFSVNLILSETSSNSSSVYTPQTGSPPNGQDTYQLVFLAAGQSTGAGIGDFTGKPDYQGTKDANGGVRTLDIIAGTWAPMQFAYQAGFGTNDPNNRVTASLVITADGHYTLDYELHEKGLWHATNGNWTRQVPTGNSYSPPSTDGGTYSFTGRDQVTLYDQFGASTWQRGS